MEIEIEKNNRFKSLLRQSKMRDAKLSLKRSS